MKGCHSNKHHTVMVVLYLWGCDPIPADVGVAYCISPYSTKGHGVTVDFLPRSQERVIGILTVWSCDHWQLSSVVTQLWTVFGRSQIVTPVAVLSTACIGVITPCEVK